MKKNGFLAISLLYSFFLVFVTIMLMIIVTYSHNRILMNSVNSKVKNQLILYSAQTEDKSGAMFPVLTNKMLPIYFDYSYGDGVWRKADINNEVGKDQWFNYEALMWANVALFESQERYDYYNSQPNGEIININDVDAFFVWIPRFRYLIFNANEMNVPSNERIRVIFEKKDEDYSLAVSNGNYTTHPAFLLPEFNIIDGKIYQEKVDGFWVGKYETTGTEYYPSIKSGNNPLLLKYINQYYAVDEFKYFMDIYYNYNTRMMKNTEWGAIAYLSQSKYGIKGNPEYDGLREIGSNNTQYTGGGKEAYSFARNNNLIQSTTGNVSGVYDMVGGYTERVTTFLEEDGNYYPIDFSLPYEKSYYDLYIGDHIHGDATLETNSWISYNNSFISSSHPTFIRGRNSIFRYERATDSSLHAFRIVIPMKGN